MKYLIRSILTWIGKLHSINKLLFSIAVMAAAFFLIPGQKSSQQHFMISWDCFSLAMIILNWVSFFTISTQDIRKESIQQDESRVIIFSLVLISTIGSLTSIILLITDKTNQTSIIIAIIGMILSWMLIHTIFALRYAHLFYRNDENDAGIHAGGLTFPGDKKPDYLDFAYFSFVIGMTFQVSDVEISARKLRRLSLLHALISFFFNTLIIALTINFISGLRK